MLDNGLKKLITENQILSSFWIIFIVIASLCPQPLSLPVNDLEFCVDNAIYDYKLH